MSQDERRVRFSPVSRDGSGREIHEDELDIKRDGVVWGMIAQQWLRFWMGLTDQAYRVTRPEKSMTSS